METPMRGFLARSREACWRLGLLAAVLALAAADRAPAQAGEEAFDPATQALIKGKITDEDGTPLHRIVITAYCDSSFTQSSTATDANGLYALAVTIVAGADTCDFYLDIYDSYYKRYQAEHYHYPDLDSSDVLTVRKGEVYENVDAQLALRRMEPSRQAIITGKVTDENGRPLEGVEVHTFPAATEEFGWSAWGRTIADGSYRLVATLPSDDPLEEPPHEYTVEFSVDAFVHQIYYDGAADRQSATKLVLAPGQTLSGIDLVLRVEPEDPAVSENTPAAGQEGFDPATQALIKGRVTDENGVPLESISVIATSATGGCFQPSLSNPTGNMAAGTGIDGLYSLVLPLDADTCGIRLRFVDPYIRRHESEYYDDAPDWGSAYTLIVQKGGVYENLDAQLALRRAALISGKVTDGDGLPLAGVEVRAERAKGASPRDRAGTRTISDGTYRLDVSLPPPSPLGEATSRYVVSFRGADQTVYYKDATDFQSATILPLAPGMGVTGIDAVLDREPDDQVSENTGDQEPAEPPRPKPPAGPEIALKVPVEPAVPPDPDPPAPPRGRRPAPPDGRVWGDVHLRTFDGIRYDFQAVGEFVGVRSTSGDLEFQIRMGPMGKSTRASLTTAVAARIAGARASVAIGREPALWVNGAPANVTDSLDLGGGARIDKTRKGYEFVWPDGSTLTVEIFRNYLNAYLTPAEGRRGRLTGLFGNYDGDDSNDPVSAAGEVLPRPFRFEDVYGTYAASWRIKQEESLFDYGPDETTATFTNLNFPTDALTASNLAPAERRRATQACRNAGVTDQAVLESCIVDVGHSGDESLTEAATAVQTHEANILAALTRPPPVMGRPVVEPAAGGLSMEAPAEGIAAFPVNVTIRGPMPPNHRLLAAPPGSDSRAIAGSSTLRPGQVFTVVLPEEAGEYELRYVATTPPYDIKLRQTIRVRAPQARIEAAESAPAGSRLPASCVGDCSPRAMLTVVPAGSSDQEIGRRNILGPSATTRLLLPNRPGQYEIRYVTVTDPKKVFARKPLSIQ